MQHQPPLLWPSPDIPTELLEAAVSLGWFRKPTEFDHGISIGLQLADR